MIYYVYKTYFKDFPCVHIATLLLVFTFAPLKHILLLIYVDNTLTASSPIPSNTRTLIHLLPQRNTCGCILISIATHTWRLHTHGQNKLWPKGAYQPPYSVHQHRIHLGIMGEHTSNTGGMSESDVTFLVTCLRHTAGGSIEVRDRRDTWPILMGVRSRHGLTLQ